MNPRRTRLLLWAGGLGAAIYFAGDMLCYGGFAFAPLPPLLARGFTCLAYLEFGFAVGGPRLVSRL
jgi:hypothetical protein